MVTNGIYIKLYVDAVRTGMLADMGPECWVTLTVLASYMDEHGECWPSQEQIARDLGVTRQTANKYVQRLLAYRWRGKPVVEARKDMSHGRYGRLIYRILPAASMSKFAVSVDVDTNKNQYINKNK